jgi:hypothetical protein
VRLGAGDNVSGGYGGANRCGGVGDSNSRVGIGVPSIGGGGLSFLICHLGVDGPAGVGEVIIKSVVGKSIRSVLSQSRS